MFHVDSSRDFQKQYKKLSIKIRIKFDERIRLFYEDSSSSILNRHLLHGEWKGYWSINITGDIRAVYKETHEGFIFVAIGNHSELYS